MISFEMLKTTVQEKKTYVMPNTTHILVATLGFFGTQCTVQLSLLSSKYRYYCGLQICVAWLQTFGRGRCKVLM